MRHPGRWMIACAGVLLAGLGIDVAVGRGLRSTARGDPPLTRTAVGSSAPVHAVVALQRDDCDSNLRLFELLHRRAVRESVELVGILNVGPADDSSAMRAMLPAWTRRIPLTPIEGSMVRQLATLGHRSSPMLLLFDQEGRLRLVTQSPRSSRELAGLRRAIEGLTWFHEL